MVLDLVAIAPYYPFFFPKFEFYHQFSRLLVDLGQHVHRILVGLTEQLSRPQACRLHHRAKAAAKFIELCLIRQLMDDVFFICLFQIQIFILHFGNFDREIN